MSLSVNKRLTNVKVVMPILVVLVAAVVVTLMMVIKPRPAKKAAGPKAWPVQVQRAVIAEYAPELTLYGKVGSPRSAALRAPTLGYIAKTPILEGQSVKAGEVVVSMDARDIDLVIRQRQAQVHELKAQIEKELNQGKADKQALIDEQRIYVLAEREMARIKPLLKRNLASLAEYERAETTLKRSALAVTERTLASENHEHRLSELQARLANAKAQLDTAKLDLERSQVKAPFSGKLTELAVSVGDRVNADQLLAKMYDKDALEIRTQIPTDYVPMIRNALAAGDEVTATTQLANDQVNLVLDRLSGQVLSTRAGVDGFFKISEATEHLPLGASIPIKVNLPKQPQLIALPPTAIYDNNRIYKVVNNRLQAVPIKVVGERMINHQLMTLIHAPAIQAGDLLATSQLPNAISGLPVQAHD